MSALPSDALAPLPAALAATGWQQAAACRFDDRDLFFPPEERGRYLGFRAAAAQRICRSCLVRGECLGYALTADELYGVWGGMTAKERTRLQRGRQARGPDERCDLVLRAASLADAAALPPVSRRAARDASRRPARGAMAPAREAPHDREGGTVRRQNGR